MGNKTTWRPEYCQMLIDHMAEGYSFVSFGSVVDAGKTTLYRWVEDIEEFREAKEKAQTKCLMHFEKLLIKKGKGTNDAKNIDLGALIFPMKTRFHAIYGDKNKVENSGEININLTYEKLNE